MKKENKSNDFKLNENTGFLHISAEKKEEKSPDYFGTMDINNEVFALGGWKKEGSKGNQHIALALRPESIEIDDWKPSKEEHQKRYLSEKKKDSDVFINVPYTGSLHRSKEQNEDYFGTVRIDDNLISITGRVTVLKDKTVLVLKKSEGMSKEKRNELANKF